METKHTKGEWKLSSERTNDIVNKAENKEDTWFNYCIDLPDHLGAIQSCSVNQSEAIANAKLIAAAPELLDALEDMTGILRWMTGDLTKSGLESLKKALDVIEKATK